MDFQEFKKKYDINTNDKQEEAVKSIYGPVLLLAVPGAGKTTVIVARTGYMVLCEGIDPSEILTLTFTNAAANEMKERYLAKFGGGKAAPRFSTIHSFCVSVIKHFELTEKHTPYVSPELVPDNTRIVRDAYIKVTGEYPSDSAVKDVAQKVTYAKNMCLGKGEISRLKVSGLNFGAFFDLYEAELKASDAMDYDDQLVLAFELLKSNADVLSYFRDKYKYVSLDEAQDTSFIQHKIIELLVGEHKNIFFSCDDDQSIYAFRAAYPKAILEFGKTYPGAKILYTETNYRSGSEIVSAASRFVSQNKERYDKKMSAARSDITCKILRTEVADAAHQYRYLLKRLSEAKKSTAVLYRNNESVVPVYDLLESSGIKFSCRDAADVFFTHYAITDMLDMLRLSQNPRDTEAYGRMYYKFGAYTSKYEVEMLPALLEKDKDIDIFEALMKNADEKQAMVYARVKRELLAAGEMSVPEAIKRLFSGIWHSRLERLQSEGCSKQGIPQKIRILFAVALEYPKIPEFLKRMDFLAKAGARNEGNITLSTVHSAKGLEYDEVIILDAFDGIFPPDAAIKEYELGVYENYEEEVRLFYVAATRAKYSLEIITTHSVFGEPADPSRFVNEFLGGELSKRHENKPSPDINVGFKNPKLDAAQRTKENKRNVCAQFPLGKRVEHTLFGAGFVTDINGDSVTVTFLSDGKAKTFSGKTETSDLRPADHI